MNSIEQILHSMDMQYHEKRANMARVAEDSLPPLKISDETKLYLDKKILCDMNEGTRPYRPRYVLPDYVKFMKQGSEYLDIEPPKDLYEAVNALMILYRYVPSITGYPVYVGQIDDVLEPFMNTVSEKEAYNLIKMLLINIDRNLPDAFVHMNIGPKDTKVGRLVIQIERELRKTIPNVTLKCSEETPDDLIKYGIESALENIKPYFVNHKLMTSDLGEDYGVVSCYNSLRIGGGAHTLTRLNLKALAQESESYDDFINNQLPKAVKALGELTNARIKYLVEDVKFFESSFLAKEGLIDLNKFTSMLGIYGTFECVEIFTGKQMGHDEHANDIAEEICKVFAKLVKSEEAVYCGGTNGEHGVHAQGGLESDIDTTPAVRIKYGCEPSIFDNINLSSRLHKYFNTGCSDIYLFDETAKNNIDGMLKVVKGAIDSGIRVLSINSNSSEFVRITGYLVKKSDVKKFNDGESLREDSVVLGALTMKNGIEERKVRNV
ncbi:YjjI family glycine radical enzyme [Paraclostridium sordellii]|uniref:YjjI family glycine radical enzyme n=1 Tax=Paraclostridium sordellii TaxID=1505 RepID=UPI0005DBCAF6|nr:YjjI family glycine radical enzyme [Paeniclostridium sordellii]CEP39226.1 putative cytoplasmic protein [[Clostridium] sordellii] [Paeniclostridium sordellii]